MSIDIDWSLLTDAQSSLSVNLIEALNTALNGSSRPSFLGPITVTSFDFGKIGPDVELRDIRDLWRAFEEGDEEEDDVSVAVTDDGGMVGEDRRMMRRDGADGRKGSYRRGSSTGQSYAPVPRGLGIAGSSGSLLSDTRWKTGPYSEIDENPYLQLSLQSRQSSFAHVPSQTPSSMAADRTRSPSRAGPDDETASVFSLPRSVQAVGIGLTPSILRRDSLLAGRPFAMSTSASLPHSLVLASGRGPAYPSHLSHHLLPSTRHAGPPRSVSHPHSLLAPQLAPLPSDSRLPLSRPTVSPPPSPPARPHGLPQSDSGIPSLQLHLHFSHSPNIRLTILTSLQVNYPSTLFMALPLKLSVTGLTLDADIIAAYSGLRHRLYLTIMDDDMSSNSANMLSPSTSTAGLSNGPATPIGQRIIPHLHIESEIGHSDAHVLRNVGKVERFIGDVLRKTIVDELVWPNFCTVEL